MFTGIVEGIASVVSVEKGSEGMRFSIVTDIVEKHSIKIGDSVSINGACHTVESINGQELTFFSSCQTLEVTNLDEMYKGCRANVEMAATLGTYLGGHIVSGHVDCVASFVSIETDGESYRLSFKIPKEYSQYVIDKGSVTLNGISLTIAELSGTILTIAVIPHTWQNTTLQDLEIGCSVNCEFDLIAKYIKRMLNPQ